MMSNCSSTRGPSRISGSRTKSTTVRGTPQSGASLAHDRIGSGQHVPGGHLAERSVRHSVAGQGQWQRRPMGIRHTRCAVPRLLMARAYSQKSLTSERTSALLKAPCVAPSGVYSGHVTVTSVSSLNSSAARW
jgi:hypothetical protein